MLNFLLSTIILNSKQWCIHPHLPSFSPHNPPNNLQNSSASWALLVYGLGWFLCSILQNGHFPEEMARYWDYVGTLVEFPYTKSVHGFNENGEESCRRGEMFNELTDLQQFFATAVDMLTCCQVAKTWHVDVTYPSDFATCPCNFLQYMSHCARQLPNFENVLEHKMTYK